ncbi:unnamed protein product [Protopolystoma xenopodis]|uniref:Uncharacterized protein n=1 Tax=Protopolystoma xenopodis TaxID=117903 RepID=A0A448XPG8_9PLAT|nr:unnamed protein product [Protopolystoma xenopodis]
MNHDDSIKNCCSSPGVRDCPAEKDCYFSFCPLYHHPEQFRRLAPTGLLPEVQFSRLLRPVLAEQLQLVAAAPTSEDNGDKVSTWLPDRGQVDAILAAICRRFVVSQMGAQTPIQAVEESVDACDGNPVQDGQTSETISGRMSGKSPNQEGSGLLGIEGWQTDDTERWGKI